MLDQLPIIEEEKINRSPAVTQYRVTSTLEDEPTIESLIGNNFADEELRKIGESTMAQLLQKIANLRVFACGVLHEENVTSELDCPWHFDNMACCHQRPQDADGYASHVLAQAMYLAETLGKPIPNSFEEFRELRYAREDLKLLDDEAIDRFKPFQPYNRRGGETPTQELANQRQEIRNYTMTEGIRRSIPITEKRELIMDWYAENICQDHGITIEIIETT